MQRAIETLPTNGKANVATKPLRMLLVSLAMASLAGCSFLQKPMGLDDPMRQAVLPNIEALQVPLPKDWWQAFGSDTLNTLVKQALTKNLTLQASEARLRAAQAEADAASAGFWPDLSVTASRAKRTVNGSALSPVTSSTAGFTTSGQFSASYEIDLWSRVRSQSKASELGFEASVQDLQAARLSVAAQVVSTWVQWVAQVQTVALFEQELKDFSTNLKLVEFRFKQGSAPASDVLQQRQLLESTKGSLATAKANAQRTANALNTLLGQAVGSQTFTPEALPTLPDMPETGLPLAVLQRRPDVQAALLQVAAADNRVAAAIANRFPQISLQATFSDQTRDSSTLFDNWVKNLSLNLVGPIFDGGARAAEVRRQKALLAQQVANYRTTALQALQETADALLQEQAQREVVDSLSKQLALSEQSLERLFAGYRNGSVNYLNILNAQQSTSVLKRNLLAAKQQLIGFRVALYRAISGPLTLEVTSND